MFDVKYLKIYFSFLPQPWKIVVPAMIFFFIMTIICFINAISTQSIFNLFCINFEDKLTGNYSCAKLIAVFSNFTSSQTDSAPDNLNIKTVYVQYILLIITAWLNPILWFVSFITICLRCIFMIDFKLVHVTVSTLPEQHNIVDKSPLSIPSKMSQDRIDMSDESEYEEAINRRDVDETSFTTARTSFMI